MTQGEAASAVGVSAGTLRRWIAVGVIPEYAGEWTPAALGKARMVARLRERGYSLERIRVATDEGRLAFGQVLELFGDQGQPRTARQAAVQTGLDPTVVTQVTQALGMKRGDPIFRGEVRLMSYVAAAIDVGFPLEALLQLIRIYGQAIGQIADAEVRLVHMYVHEPLMRAGSGADEMAQELTDLVGEVLPLSALMIDEFHRRLLAQFIDQDVIGHMEAELGPDDDDGGRVPVTVAFADLAGYTRLIEEQGELTAIDAVERFLGLVTSTLPDEARVIKTIGDEVMIVGADAAALAAWAVELERRQRGRRGQPLPRIGLHHGHALYRDGDYYGRAVNLASRVASRSGAGEVLVTRPIVEAAGDELHFERIDDARLPGFTAPIEIFRASAAR